MLSELKDGHVQFKTEGGAIFSTYRPPRELKDKNTFNPLTIRNYFTSELKLGKNKKLEYGILGNNIGYLRISTFKKDSWEESDLSEALFYLKNTNGLIIDVRNNNGGSSKMTKMVIGRLTEFKIRNLPIKYNGHWREADFIEPIGSSQYLRPIAILINGACFSSTEDFLAICDQLPQIALIGDTTAGGSGNPDWYFLSGSKSIRICRSYICRMDSLPIEWNGISPDIRIVQTEKDLKNGVDKQLEYAMKYLNRQ